MSLKHLFAGIMGGGFALILGVDPLTVAPGGVSPGFDEADKFIAKAEEEKPAERSAVNRVQDKIRLADRGKELDRADKPAALETSWTHRLVFPAGNKF